MQKSFYRFYLHNGPCSVYNSQNLGFPEVVQMLLARRVHKSKSKFEIFCTPLFSSPPLSASKFQSDTIPDSWRNSIVVPGFFETAIISKTSAQVDSYFSETVNFSQHFLLPIECPRQLIILVAVVGLLYGGATLVPIVDWLRVIAKHFRFQTNQRAVEFQTQSMTWKIWVFRSIKIDSFDLLSTKLLPHFSGLWLIFSNIDIVSVEVSTSSASAFQYFCSFKW